MDRLSPCAWRLRRAVRVERGIFEGYEGCMDLPLMHRKSSASLGVNRQSQASSIVATPKSNSASTRSSSRRSLNTSSCSQSARACRGSLVGAHGLHQTRHRVVALRLVHQPRAGGDDSEGQHKPPRRRRRSRVISSFRGVGRGVNADLLSNPEGAAVAQEIQPPETTASARGYAGPVANLVGRTATSMLA